MPCKVSSLVIAVEREEQAVIWADIVRDVASIEIHRISHSQLEQMIDAEVLPGIFAHERYGGSPQYGKSQMLSTEYISPWHKKPENRIPAWVVTTPPFALKDDCLVIPDKPEVSFTRDITGQSQEVYYSFKCIFTAIENANTAGNSCIKSVGFSAGLIYIYYDVKVVAESVKRAYVDHIGKA